MNTVSLGTAVNMAEEARRAGARSGSGPPCPSYREHTPMTSTPVRRRHSE